MKKQQRRRKSERPRPTARGRGLLLVAVTSVIVGGLTGSAVLVQIGLLGFGILVVARVWCAWNLQRVRVTRILPRSAFSAADFDLDLEVENAKRRMPARGVIVSDRFLPFHERGVSVEALPGGEMVSERFRTRVVGRGRVRGAGYRIESSFPLGLFKSTRRRRGKEAILIYPRPVLPAALRASGFDVADDESGAGLLPNRHGELRGVREFQNGDPLKHIVWPAFARTGKLVVREFDRPLPERYSLLFHSYCPTGKMIWPEAFEHALSLLAGLLFLGREQNVPLDLCAPFTGWQRYEIRDPRDLSAPLEMLALAPHEPAGDLEAVSATLRGLSGTHPVFVVSEAPVKYWADKLPEVGRIVTCLDNRTMRVKRPSLSKFRRVA